jgi:predicted metal-dependent phosphoesterase TrpH
MLIDLHVHSNESDGSLSPDRLIDLAVSQGITTLSLTDHDTTAGLARFTEYGLQKNIRTFQGIELSATWQKSGSCHFLGYGVHENCPRLEQVLSEIRQSRDTRNATILGRLATLGFPLQMEDVAGSVAGGVMSRPHIAKAMVAAGYVASIQEAFDRFLVKGAPGYVDRYHLEPGAAVALLSQVGALSVLAHPSQLKLSIENLESFVAELKPLGLAGMEVFTPYTPVQAIPSYLSIVQKYDLVATGGSDFHGATKPNNFLGHYSDMLPIPAQCSEELIVAMKKCFASKQVGGSETGK